MKFTFNKSARAATIDALKKLANRVVPALTFFGVAFFNVTEVVAITFSSLFAFVFCHVGIIIVAGIEDKVEKKDKIVNTDKPKTNRRSTKTKVNDTS